MLNLRPADPSVSRADRGRLSSLHLIRGAAGVFTLLLALTMIGPARSQTADKANNGEVNSNVLALDPAAVNVTQTAPASTPQNTGKKKPARKVKPGKVSKALPIVVKPILVFPPDTKGGVTDQVSDLITDIEESRLSLSGVYSPIYFLESLATVKRALSEQSLTKADVTNPFDDAGQQRVNKLLGVTHYECAFITSVDDYQFDTTTNKITSIVLTARLIDVSNEVPIIRSASLSFPSEEVPDRSPRGASEHVQALLAFRELTEKVMSELLPGYSQYSPTTSSKLRKGK